MGYSAEQVTVLVAPPRMDPLGAEAEVLAQKVRQGRPGVAVLGFGFPQSEVFAVAHLNDIACHVMCVGSAVDVLSGLSTRAPKLWGWLGLEWLWRLCREPRRLWRRYLWESRFFVAAAWHDMWASEVPHSG